ncbi:hypothetical protein HYDPIDRAFT_107865 [Hydnomerulius pinastri MD-312]|nr:hypothetical protein HYDPIDRAFT_107865 [Hydnomerulius pinastri MD-312]
MVRHRRIRFRSPIRHRSGVRVRAWRRGTRRRYRQRIRSVRRVAYSLYPSRGSYGRYDAYTFKVAALRYRYLCRNEYPIPSRPNPRPHPLALPPFHILALPSTQIPTAPAQT